MTLSTMTVGRLMVEYGATSDALSSEPKAVNSIIAPKGNGPGVVSLNIDDDVARSAAIIQAAGFQLLRLARWDIRPASRSRPNGWSTGGRLTRPSPKPSR